MRLAASLACVAFVVSTTAFASADFVTIPAKQLTNGTPVFVTATSVFVDPNNSSSFRACISFKNTTAKPENFVRFTFQFDDTLGNHIAEAILDRSGDFGPGIDIEGKMSALG